MIMIGIRDSGQKIVSDGLILHWDASQLRSYPTTGSIISDISGRLDSGSLINVTPNSDYGGSLFFTGSGNSHVIASSNTNTQLSPLTGFTIGSWIYPEYIRGTDGGDFNTQLAGEIAGRAKTNAALDEAAWRLILSMNLFSNSATSYTMAIGYLFNGIDNRQFIGTTPRWQNEEWNFIMAGHSGSNVKIWVNGVHIGTLTGFPTTTNMGSDLRYSIGQGGTGGGQSPYKGKISVSYVYNRLLSDAEVLQNYNALKPRYMKPPLNITYDGLVLSLDAGNSNSYLSVGNNWWDISGQGNNATLINYEDSFSLLNSGSINFDGANDYANIDPLNSLNTQYSTVEAWVKLDQPTNNLTQHIVSRTNTSAGTFNLIKRSDNRWGLNFRDSSNTQTLMQFNTTATTGWTQVVATYDGTTLKGYVNGSLDKEQSASGTINTGSSLVMNIARNTTNIAFMDGRIAVVRLYNRALTATEVTTNFNAIKGRFGL